MIMESGGGTEIRKVSCVWLYIIPIYFVILLTVGAEGCCCCCCCCCCTWSHSVTQTRTRYGFSERGIGPSQTLLLHNTTFTAETVIPSAVFEAAFRAVERPPTDAFDRSTTGIGWIFSPLIWEVRNRELDNWTAVVRRCIADRIMDTSYLLTAS